MVYSELRKLAAHRMAQEPSGQTLQPTALVHEAWLRLGRGGEMQWDNKAHFFGAAAEAMRRILVDQSRRKQQMKRGGGRERVDLEESRMAAPTDDEKLLKVHAALELLALQDPQKAEIVKLRYFVGLNHLEIAGVLQIHEKTVRRHWQVAKIQLFELIQQADTRACRELQK